MLKSKVPVYLCSTLLTIALLSAANRRESTWNLKNSNFHESGSMAALNSSWKNKISMTLPDKQGMKFVRNYIRRNNQCLFDVKQKSEVPFSIIDSVFKHYGLPTELKYLAVIESELKPSAVSPVGAKGPWQLMPGTAHVLGLKVNYHSDERVNYYKSTRAAAKYLRDLHREFRDWLLVLAAYNGGPGPVNIAIRKSHSRNFWILQRYLPAESRNHVKKFIATDCYFEGAANTNAVAKSTAVTRDKQLKIQPTKTKESAEEKFARIMSESAKSLQKSNELLGTAN